MGESVPTAAAGDIHLHWMREAMLMVRTHPPLSSLNDLRADQAEEAMAAKEVPVGCVFIRDNKIIAKARNRTNELRNVSPPSSQFPVRALNPHSRKPGNEACGARSNRRHPL